MKFTRQQFEEMVGNPPKDDDLERLNCDRPGEIGHLACGHCSHCNKPRFICGHIYEYRETYDVDGSLDSNAS